MSREQITGIDYTACFRWFFSPLPKYIRIKKIYFFFFITYFFFFFYIHLPISYFFTRTHILASINTRVMYTYTCVPIHVCACACQYIFYLFEIEFIVDRQRPRVINSVIFVLYRRLGCGREERKEGENTTRRTQTVTISIVVREDRINSSRVIIIILTYPFLVGTRLFLLHVLVRCVLRNRFFFFFLSCVFNIFFSPSFRLKV